LWKRESAGATSSPAKRQKITYPVNSAVIPLAHSSSLINLI